MPAFLDTIDPVFPEPGSPWHPSTEKDISLPTLVSRYHHKTFALPSTTPSSTFAFSPTRSPDSPNLATSFSFEDVLESIIQSQKAADPPLPAINVDREQGAMLAILVKQAVMVGKGLSQAKDDLWGGGKVVEVGTLGGYSTVWLGRGLQHQHHGVGGSRIQHGGGKALGRVISLEIDPHHTKLARDNVAKAGMSDFVKVWNIPGQEGVERLLETDEENRVEGGDDDLLGEGLDEKKDAEKRKGSWKGKVDLIFIDADKTGARNYFLTALKLSRPGGLIIVDNTVRQGSVIDQYNTSEGGFDDNSMGIRWLNEEIRKKLDSGEVEIGTALQTIGEKGYDGFTILVKSW